MNFLAFVILSAGISYGKVEDLLKARTSAEIERLHKRDVETQILYQRCNIELREKWLPHSCFAWLSHSDLQQVHKVQIDAFFQQRCKVAAERGGSRFSHSLALTKINSGPCFEALRQFYLDWRYRAQQNAELPEMSRVVGFGREFEMKFGHERKKDPKSRRLPNN